MYHIRDAVQSTPLDNKILRREFFNAVHIILADDENGNEKKYKKYKSCI